MKSLAERVVTTFVVAFVGALPFTMVLTVSDTKAVGLAAAGAGLAAVIALAKNGVFNPTSTNVWLNVAERGAWSFLQGAAAMVPVTINLADLGGLKSIAFAALSGGVTAVLSFAKNLTAAASATNASKALNVQLGGPAAGFLTPDGASA